MIRQLLSSGLGLFSNGAIDSISSNQRNPIISHPWERIQATWMKGSFANDQKGAWILIMKPAFVNGIDPIVKSVVGYNRATGGVIASDQAGVGGAAQEHYIYGKQDYLFQPAKPFDLPMLGYPMLALNFIHGLKWPNGTPTPMFFQNLGVVPSNTDNNGMKVVIDESTGQVTVTTSPSTTAETPKTYRVAVSVDIMLGQARPVLQQTLTVTGDILSNTIVNYSTAYNDSTIRKFGLRPFVYQTPNGETAINAQNTLSSQSWADLFNGRQQADDGIDKLWIARAWAVSPPIALDQQPSAVDNSWIIYFQYKTFTNLAYKLKRPALYNVPSNISYSTPLAGGAANILISEYLSLQNDVTDALTQAYFNSTPLGRFWSI